MAKNYYTVLTTYGAQLFAQAMANRQQVRITQFAVGDGNGRAVQPDSARTSLVREVHRANISAVSTDPRNNRQVIFELTIPENVGGFWIREMGIYDNNNRLVAYANCPDTYKPQLSEGSGKIQVVRMILLVSSSNAVTLSVDDSVIFVTRGQLTPKNITATSTNGFDETGHTHHIDKATTTQAGITQLADNLTTADNTKALTAAQGKILQDSKMDGMVKTVINLNHLSSEVWYPVVFSGLVKSQTARFSVRSQYQSKPAWSTHSLGFTLNLNWTSNASNWGGNEVTRVIERFDYRFINENKSPVLKVEQLHSASEEYCYLRGGATYEVWHEPYVRAAYYASTYTWRSGDYAYSLPLITTYDSTLVPKTNLTTLRELADSKVSKAGDTMTGQLSIHHQMAHVRGLRNGAIKWIVGLRDPNRDDVSIYSYAHHNELSLEADKTVSNKPLYVGFNKVLTMLDLANNLTTNDNTKALTAAQGKALNEAKADKATTLAGYGITDWNVRNLNNEDLNNVTRPGSFGQVSNARALVELHYPEVQAGALLVSQSAYGVQQEYTTYLSLAKYVRNLTAGGYWTNWKRVDGADWSDVRRKPTTLDGYGTTSAQPLIINAAAPYLRGQRNGLNNWFLGLSNGQTNDFRLLSHIYNTELTLKSDRTESNKPLYVGANKVLTEADLSNSLTGAVMYFAMTSPPEGWLKADGRAVSRTTYATLFARIGTTFGAGDGRTTFNLPDLRGEFIRGWDNGRNVDSGRAFGSAQKSSMQALASTGKSLVTGITNKDNTPTDIWRRAQHDKINQSESGYQDVKASYTSTFSWHGRNELGVVNNGNNEIEFGGVRPRNVALLACIKY